jgi:hypothetical protein
MEVIRLKRTILFPLCIHLLKLMLQNGNQSEILKSLELFVVDYVICSWILEERIQGGQFCAGGKEGQNACVVSVENT